VNNQQVTWRSTRLVDECGLLDPQDLVGNVEYYQTAIGSSGFLTPDCNFGQEDVLYYLNGVCALFDANRNANNCAGILNAQCGCTNFCGQAVYRVPIGSPPPPAGPPYVGSPVTIDGVVMP
jgi:hypothetical protein